MKKVIAVDWSNDDDNLAVYDGKVITNVLPEPVSGLIIATENLPTKYARPYFDVKGVQIFRCSTQMTAKERRDQGIEKSHEGDAQIIYQQFHDSPESFREWKFDPYFAQITDIYAFYKGVQHTRVAMGNRVYANSHVVVQETLSILEQREACHLKELKKIVEGMPIYVGFLSEIKGVGPATAAGLIAMVQNVGRFSSVSHLMAYFGLHVVDGVAPKRTKGQKSNWNHRGRALILGTMGDGFVKHRTPVYRDTYDEEKAKQLPICQEHFKEGWRRIAHRGAIRKMMKSFMKDFYNAYKRLGCGADAQPILPPPKVKKTRKRKLAVVA